MSAEKLALSYACKLCGVKDVSVPVRFRWSSEDVVAWMERVAVRAVREDHARRSPWCRAKTADLTIPVPEGTGHIGGPVLQ